MRSMLPRASRRSAFVAIICRSVEMSWNLTVELPKFRTSTFIVKIHRVFEG
jgi:hypothetical protein